MRLIRPTPTTVRVLALAALLACDSDGPSAPRAGTIAGRILTSTEPVVGATANLTGVEPRTTTSNASGEFYFTSVIASTYTVTVTLPAAFELLAGQPASRSAVVVAGDTTTLEWSARRVTDGGTGGQ